jgi:hypothetical protein
MKIPSLLVLSLALFPLLGSANEKGNGGGAFVCRDATGKILSAELVDLYEAKNQLGLTIQNFGRASLDQRLEAIQLRAHQADPEFGPTFDEYLQIIREKLRVVGNVTLENTNDFQISISPRRCAGGKIRFEQLASYTPTGDLIVDGEIYRHLSRTNQAALYVHEALYLIARVKYGSVSSLEARVATGYLFSTEKVAEIQGVLSMIPDAGIPNKKFECRTTYFPPDCFTARGCSPDSGFKVTAFGKDKETAIADYVSEARRLGNFLSGFERYLPCGRWASELAVDRKQYINSSKNRTFQCLEISTPENACFPNF